MPRPLAAGVVRPACRDPQHAGGRIWLSGYYARNGFHERPRFLCAPPPADPGQAPAWKRHRFTDVLPRRHGSPDHPLGKACESCDHAPDHDEGPSTGRNFTFTVREAASALVAAGRGLTYRRTSHATRQHAWPARKDRPRELSWHAQLAMNYLDAFGDEIYSRSAEIAWPKVLILDALPQHEKDTMAGGAKKKGGRRAFSILAAYGYRDGKGKLWRLGVYGAEDAYEWERFLRTMPGEPRWVVCDQAGAIAKAVKVVWPDAVIDNGEWHISTAGLRWVRPTQLGDRYPEIARLVKRATKGPAELAELAELAAALATLAEVPPKLASWVERQRKSLPALWAKRQPDMPRGSGPLEQKLDAISAALHQRRFRFRNLGRLERLLALMLLSLNGDADERDYARIIADHLKSHAGQLAGGLRGWRQLADPKRSGSSLRELVKQAELRIGREKALVEHRKINRRIERDWRRRWRIEVAMRTTPRRSSAQDPTTPATPLHSGPRRPEARTRRPRGRVLQGTRRGG